MSKNFYVIVPYVGIGLGPSGGGVSGIFNSKKKNIAQENERFEEKRSQLEQRLSVVQQGLSSMGIRNSVLNTQQLIELFYSVFNPEEPKKAINLEGVSEEDLNSAQK